MQLCGKQTFTNRSQCCRSLHCTLEKSSQSTQYCVVANHSSSVQAECDQQIVLIRECSKVLDSVQAAATLQDSCYVFSFFHPHISYCQTQKIPFKDIYCRTSSLLLLLSQSYIRLSEDWRMQTQQADWNYMLLIFFWTSTSIAASQFLAPMYLASLVN